MYPHRIGGQREVLHMAAQLNSWLGHARQADTFRLRQRVFRHLWLDERLVVRRAPAGKGWRVLGRAYADLEC